MYSPQQTKYLTKLMQVEHPPKEDVSECVLAMNFTVFDARKELAKFVADRQFGDNHKV